MADATQQRSRSSTTKTPPASSDDGTLTDTPLADTPINVDGLHQHDQVQCQDDPAHDMDQQQHDAPSIDEIGPLGAHVKEALSIASSLAQLALDTSEISIPRCVVLGQQSAGKSSVIEAISGIKTPRDTGTCTRCPLYIDMQPSEDPNDEWIADVFLLREFEVHRPGLKVTDFPGWAPATKRGRIPFARTTDPAQLEVLIACAQRATLSPLLDHKLFLNPAYRNTHMHSTLFSPNPVGISIRKPGLPSLSFFDLPGLIAQAETDEEEFTVPLVENLVSLYVRDPESLVLVATALENDMATSTAAKCARNCKATPRCIGVLTKPDRLAPGTSSNDLTRILDGDSFKLGHGYFVVRNLDKKQIQQCLTHNDARQLEQEFFSTSAPWADDLQRYRHRFGTVNLQHYLSMQLGKQIVAKLPGIKQRIQNRLQEVEAELSQMPEIPLHTAQRTVCDVLQAFTVDIRNEVNGDYGYESWDIVWRALQQKFWTVLKESRPTMMTTGRRDEGIFTSTLPGGSSDGAIIIDDSDETIETPETPSKKRKHGSSTKREAQTPAPSNSPSITPKKPAARSSQAQRTGLSRNPAVVDSRKVFNLDEVAAHVAQSSKGRVSGGLHPKARENLMLSALSHWETTINGFFDELKDQLTQRIQVLFDSHFCNWRDSQFYKESLVLVKAILENHLSEQRTVMATEALKAERLRPYTIDEDIFDADKLVVMQRYRDARFKARHTRYLREAREHYERDLSQTEKERMLKEKTALFKSEPYERELNLVADVTTYYMIAARRLIEGIVMRIDDKFFQALRNTLLDQLRDDLDIMGEQGPCIAQRLLAESPARLDRRNALVNEKDRLLQGLKCFEEYWQKYHAGTADQEPPNFASNYQRPSVSTPTADEMEDVRSHSLPHRSISRPAV